MLGIAIYVFPFSKYSNVDSILADHRTTLAFQTLFSRDSILMLYNEEVNCRWAGSYEGSAGPARHGHSKIETF